LKGKITFYRQKSGRFTIALQRAEEDEMKEETETEKNETNEQGECSTKDSS